jgi:hypothetical protein
MIVLDENPRVGFSEPIRTTAFQEAGGFRVVKSTTGETQGEISSKTSNPSA